MFYGFSSNPGLVATWSLPVPLVFPRFCNVFRWISKIFKGFCKIYSCLSCLFRLRVVFWVPRFSKKNANPFAAFSSAYFGDAVTDHVTRGSVLFFGFPDFSKKS